MRYILVIIIELFLFSIYAQKDEIIDPIQINCYDVQVNQPLMIQDNSDYQGRILVQSKCDTVNLLLVPDRIMLAKLRSINLKSDSIEIRLDYKFGNFAYVDSIKSLIFNKIGKRKIIKTNYLDCLTPYFMVIVKINIE